MKRVSNLIAGALTTALVFMPGWVMAQAQTDSERYGYTPPPELERYIEICQRIYKRMEREGFPWNVDSQLGTN